MSDDQALRDLEAAFDDAGLARPPVPVALRRDLRALEAWCWSTRDDIDAGQMYAFGAYPLEALVGRPQNYLAVGHGGHGINSYAITYLLVYGRLALFTQALWGGTYSDGSSEAAVVSALFDRCARVVATYESCAAADLLPASARLIVVEHDLRPRRSCGWLSQPLQDDDAAQEWLESQTTSEPATDAALALLNTLGTAPPTGAVTAFSPRKSPVLSAFSPVLQAGVRSVLERHPQLPRPGVDYAPWITGCLGDPNADVWFIAENPSAGAAARAGIDATVEDQWRITPGDMLFRQALVDFGFKDPPADGPGGWRCYITDVVKSPYVVDRWNARSVADRKEVARWWAPVLSDELASGAPRVIVTLGRRARYLLTYVESKGLVDELPAIRVAIDHYVYVQSRPRRGVPGGDAARVAEWRQRFAEIASLRQDLRSETGSVDE